MQGQDVNTFWNFLQRWVQAVDVILRVTLVTQQDMLAILVLPTDTATLPGRKWPAQPFAFVLPNCAGYVVCWRHKKRLSSALTCPSQLTDFMMRCACISSIAHMQWLASTSMMANITLPHLLACNAFCMYRYATNFHLARSSTMLLLLSCELPGSLELPGEVSVLPPFFSFFTGVGA